MAEFHSSFMNINYHDAKLLIAGRTRNQSYLCANFQWISYSTLSVRWGTQVTVFSEVASRDSILIAGSQVKSTHKLIQPSNIERSSPLSKSLWKWQNCLPRKFRIKNVQSFKSSRSSGASIEQLAQVNWRLEGDITRGSWSSTWSMSGSISIIKESTNLIWAN